MLTRPASSDFWVTCQVCDVKTALPHAGTRATSGVTYAHAIMHLTAFADRLC